MAICDICRRPWRTTELKWTCKRCQDAAAGMSGATIGDECGVTIMPRARRPFRQVLALALLVSATMMLGLLGETLILVFR